MGASFVLEIRASYTKSDIDIGTSSSNAYEMNAFHLVLIPIFKGLSNNDRLHALHDLNWRTPVISPTGYFDLNLHELARNAW